LSNIVDYEDGTLAVGRMAAERNDTVDRGTYWTFFDGSIWLPMRKVEQARRGWSNLSALFDGRSVTVSSSAHEVNIDSRKGAGMWTSTITGFVSGTSAIEPSLVIDGRDNIFVVSTTIGKILGVGNPKQVATSRDKGVTWSHQILWPDTTFRKPQFAAGDQAADSFGDKIAVAIAETFGDVHLWESFDNGFAWTYRNLTNYSDRIPMGEKESRPAGSADALYDHNGSVHVFWETYLAVPDTSGAAIEFYESEEVGIHHWSEATGEKEIVVWADIPGAEREAEHTLWAGGSFFDQTGVDGDLIAQPQAGVDAEGNLYLLFASFRPLDFDADSAHYTDIYALGSKDGGKTWGSIVNVTDSPQSEDLWASLADNIGDSLRFVYQSDGSTGNSIQGGGEAPTTVLYYAFPKSKIPLERTSVADGYSNRKIPTAFALRQNYPNPFNPSTTIRFDLPEAGHVSLKVFNLLGNEVMTLVDEHQSEGAHQVELDGASMQSGVYLCRLQAGSFSQAIKVTLLK